MKPWMALLLLFPAAGEDAVEVRFAPTGDKLALQAAVAAEIGRAREEVRVAMYHFTSERLAAALGERRRAGATVRLLLDAAQSDPEFVRGLRAAGLEVRLVKPRGEEARFHHKFCVLDGRTVVTGSYNWTYRGDAANHENLVTLRDARAAAEFSREFDAIWNDREIAK
jgi:phosphatidylserine/phosphatidylglycerophosphate/cardiolipin synthase-like enzyme